MSLHFINYIQCCILIIIVVSIVVISPRNFLEDLHFTRCIFYFRSIKYKSLFCSFYHQAGTKSLFARHHGRMTTRLIFPASPPHKEDFVSHSLSLSRGKILQINTARRSDVGACWHLTSFISLAHDNTLLLFNFRTSI